MLYTSRMCIQLQHWMFASKQGKGLWQNTNTEWLTITLTVLTLIPTSCLLSWVREFTSVTTFDSPGSSTMAERLGVDLEFGYTSSRLKVTLWTALSSELSEAMSAFTAVWVTWAADVMDSNNLCVNGNTCMTKNYFHYKLQWNLSGHTWARLKC